MQSNSPEPSALYITSASNRFEGAELVFEFAYRLVHTPSAANDLPALNQVFTHQVRFYSEASTKRLKAIAPQLDKLTIWLAMTEALSYWKLTTSPVIYAPLSAYERKWFHTLLIEGMGEYFYVNDIDFTPDDFVRFEHYQAPTANSPTNTLPLDASATERLLTRGDVSAPLSTEQHSVLIPLGGGKDSIVTLEAFKRHLSCVHPYHNRLGCLIINPTPAAREVAQAGGLTTHEVKRILDPQLLKLNKRGYRNGHVPISASFAFISMISALLADYDYIALSNERSSNEGNVLYRGKQINHQYSKSFAFEQSLAELIESATPQMPHSTLKSALDPRSGPFPLYFSFVRPLYELQIMQRFAQLPYYHQIFRSCNRTSTKNWCGECPKCLFGFLALGAFLPNDEVVQIFGADLLQNAALIPLLEALVGTGTNKPFECVGTYEETKVACVLALGKQRSAYTTLPPLLEYIQANLDIGIRAISAARALLSIHGEHHAIPYDWEAWLYKKTWLSKETTQQTAYQNKKQLPKSHALVRTTLAKQHKDTTIVIMGLGREGRSLQQFFDAWLENPNYLLLDDATPNDGKSFVPDPKKRYRVYMSPGVPPHHPLLQRIDNQPNITISSNTQLFFDLAKQLKNIKTIGVTGTKGKSTTASAIAHVLSDNDFECLLGGNIGVPPLDMLNTILQAENSDGAIPTSKYSFGRIKPEHTEKTIKTTYCVLELSCHQLARLTTSPHIAVIQNITPEHLDYYGTFAAYLQSKSAIARFQTKTDICLYNPKYETAAQLAALSPGKKILLEPDNLVRESFFEGPDAFWFSAIPGTIPDVRTDTQSGMKPSAQSGIQPDPQSDVRVFDLGSLPILGAHNVENILPSIHIATHLGVAVKESVRSLHSFTPLPHRLELIEHALVPATHHPKKEILCTFVNDSLATTPQATQAAISSLITHKMVLIVGGYDRGQDFSELSTTIAQSQEVIGIVALPTTGDRIIAELTEKTVKSAKNMHEAVQKSLEIIQNYQEFEKYDKTAIVLSPASASFNLFADYQARAEAFVQEVNLSICPHTTDTPSSA